MSERIDVRTVDAGPQFPRYDRRARNLELAVRSARMDKVEQPIARRSANEMAICRLYLRCDGFKPKATSMPM